MMSTCKFSQTMTLRVTLSITGNNAIHVPPSGLKSLSLRSPVAHAQCHLLCHFLETTLILERDLRISFGRFLTAILE